jgi:hypothetical protein
MIAARHEATLGVFPVPFLAADQTARFERDVPDEAKNRLTAALAGSRVA